MRVALLLSGLPRMVEEGYNSTWSHVINNYDTDVYLQTWKDDSWGSDWKNVYRVYDLPQVKSLDIQSPFKFTKYKEGISLPHQDKSRPLPEYDVISCFRQLPMFYSWQKVYQNLTDTKIEYDCIIRSRYDLSLKSILNLDNLDLNYLNHAPGGNFFDDNLCITNFENSYTVFHQIFDKIINKARLTGTINSAESSWTSLIKDSKCEVKVIEELRFDLLRENHLWWGK
jgi:hypothetical protein